MIKRTAIFALTLCTIILVVKMMHAKPPRCINKEACETNPDCLCYSSNECTFRRKNLATDAPVFIEDDPYGNYCYCKRSDFDNYQKNQCVLNENN